MADLFGEVESDLRAEQARAMAKRYGGVVVGLVLIVVVGAIVWQLLTVRRARNEAKLSAAYFAAMQSTDEAGLANQASARTRSIALFRRLAQADAVGIRSLSRLRLAELQADAGDRAAAVADLDTVAGDLQAPRPLRDLATLASVQRQMSTANPATLALRLQGIEQEGAPFRALALETTAMIDLAAGKTEESRRTLQLLLADENATDAIRERANTLLQAISPPAAGG